MSRHERITSRTWVRVTAALLWCLGGPWATRAPLAQQTAAPGTRAAPAPPRSPATFGRPDTSRSGGRHTVSFTLALKGMYDDALLGPDSEATGRERGTIGGLVQTTMLYMRRGERLAFGVGMGSAQRYYPEVNEVLTIGHRISAGMALGLWRGATFRTSQQVGYSPLYSLNASAAGPLDAAAEAGSETLMDLTPPAFDFALARHKAYTAQSTASLTQQFGRQTSVSWRAGLRRTTFARSDLDALEGTSYGVSVSRRVTRHGSLRLAYDRQVASLVTGIRSTADNLDAGLDYSRSLSITRRTHATFGTGSTLLTVRDRKQFQLLGWGGLSREIGQTWLARLEYRRGLEFLEYVAEPMLADTVSVNIGGRLARRLEVAVNAAHTPSRRGIQVERGPETTVGHATVQLALTRIAAFQIEYSYYGYRSASLPETALPVPPFLERHAIQAGVTVTAPLYKSRR